MRISSLSMKILFQGWFFLANFISADKNPLLGMIFLWWIHPCRWKSSSKDDSSSRISSLLMKIFFQGWFFLANFIPVDKNPLAGMILPRKFHLCRWKSSSKDDSSPRISSLPIKILSQGYIPCKFQGLVAAWCVSLCHCSCESRRKSGKNSKNMI